MDLDGSAVTAVSHGTTVATNQLLEGKLDRIGFITTEGYESVLEIARQSVPDGYGNSYFWVKPPRIVPGRPGAAPCAAGSTTTAPRSARSTRTTPARPPASSGTPASPPSASASCTPTRTTPTSGAMLEVLRGRAPRLRRLASSSEVLREYREYERSVTTLVDAAVKPKVGAYVTNIRTRLDEIAPRRAVLRDEEQRRRAVGGRGRAPADHHDAVRPGRRRPGRRADRRHRRASTGCSPATAAAPRPTSPSSSTASRRSPPRARSATTRPRSR